MARIDPLPEDEWGEDVAPILGATPPGTDMPLGRLNIFSTLARNPELFKAWMPFGGYLLTAGTLSGRDRELLILRTALNCGSPYEWGQHVRISRGGRDRARDDRPRGGGPGRRRLVRRGVSAPARGRRAARATRRSATTPGRRSPKAYDEKQLIEIPMVVGQYHMVAFTLNSLGVEQDEGLEDLPGASGARLARRPGGRSRGSATGTAGVSTAPERGRDVLVAGRRAGVLAQRRDLPVRRVGAAVLLARWPQRRRCSVRSRTARQRRRAPRCFLPPQ